MSIRLAFVGIVHPAVHDELRLLRRTPGVTAAGVTTQAAQARRCLAYTQGTGDSRHSPGDPPVRGFRAASSRRDHVPCPWFGRSPLLTPRVAGSVRVPLNG